MWINFCSDTLFLICFSYLLTDFWDLGSGNSRKIGVPLRQGTHSGKGWRNTFFWLFNNIFQRFQIYCSRSSGKCILIFSEIARLFSKVVIPFYGTSSNEWEFLLLSILDTLVTAILFILAILIICNGISLWFYFTFLNDWWLMIVTVHV